MSPTSRPRPGADPRQSRQVFPITCRLGADPMLKSARIRTGKSVTRGYRPANPALPRNCKAVRPRPVSATSAIWRREGGARSVTPSRETSRMPERASARKGAGAQPILGGRRSRAVTARRHPQGGVHFLRPFGKAAAGDARSGWGALRQERLCRAPHPRCRRHRDLSRHRIGRRCGNGGSRCPSSRPARRIWTTCEEPLAIAASLRQVLNAAARSWSIGSTVWLSDLMRISRDIEAETQALLTTLPGLRGPVVFVSNDVGLGIVPDNALAREFRDHAGRLQPPSPPPPNASCSSPPACP